VTEKLIENGHVAVLVSRGYGAGWSTWIYDYPDCVFDPVIARMILDGAEETEIAVVAEKRYPDAYLGGIDGLSVQWIPIGTRFRIDEYDGAESVEILDDINWLEA
jgi:hypothetical protein